MSAQTDKNPRVIQGTIEKSNVRSVIEMTRMIEVTRSYTQIAHSAIATFRLATFGDR